MKSARVKTQCLGNRDI